MNGPRCYTLSALIVLCNARYITAMQEKIHRPTMTPLVSGYISMAHRPPSDRKKKRCSTM